MYGLIGSFCFWFLMVIRGSTFLGFTLRSGEIMRRRALHKWVAAAGRGMTCCMLVTQLDGWQGS